MGLAACSTSKTKVEETRSLSSQSRSRAWSNLAQRTRTIDSSTPKHGETEHMSARGSRRAPKEVCCFHRRARKPSNQSSLLQDFGIDCLKSRVLILPVIFCSAQEPLWQRHRRAQRSHRGAPNTCECQVPKVRSMHTHTPAQRPAEKALSLKVTLLISLDA